MVHSSEHFKPRAVHVADAWRTMRRWRTLRRGGARARLSLTFVVPLAQGSFFSSLKTSSSAQPTGCVLTREKSNRGCAGSGVPSGSDETAVSGAVSFRAVRHRPRAVALKDYRQAKKQYERRSRGSRANTATLPGSQSRVTNQLYMTKADFMKQRHA